MPYDDPSWSFSHGKPGGRAVLRDLLVAQTRIMIGGMLIPLEKEEEMPQRTTIRRATTMGPSSLMLLQPGMTLTSILAIAAWVSGAIYLASSDRSSPSSESTSRNGNHDGKKRAAALALAQGRSFPTLSDLERQGAYELIAEGGMNMVYASAG
ncbi:unnamed protein product, partial [Amoebophrya sp. A25]|eukprot:GSA25T00000811001.1